MNIVFYCLARLLYLSMLTVKCFSIMAWAPSKDGVYSLRYSPVHSCICKRKWLIFFKWTIIDPPLTHLPNLTIAVYVTTFLWYILIKDYFISAWLCQQSWWCWYGMGVVCHLSIVQAWTGVGQNLLRRFLPNFSCWLPCCLFLTFEKDTFSNSSQSYFISINREPYGRENSKRHSFSWVSEFIFKKFGRCLTR